MKPGTKVYWYRTDPVAHYKWRYHNGPKPEPEKCLGTLVTEPVRNVSGWSCLVMRDLDGKIEEKHPKDLYVVMQVLPL